MSGLILIVRSQFTDHHGAGLRHEKGRRLWFDVSEVPVGETIFNAELRLYQASNYTFDPDDAVTISAHKIISVDHDGLVAKYLYSFHNHGDV